VCCRAILVARLHCVGGGGRRFGNPGYLGNGGDGVTGDVGTKVTVVTYRSFGLGYGGSGAYRTMDGGSGGGGSTSLLSVLVGVRNGGKEGCKDVEREVWRKAGTERVGGRKGERVGGTSIGDGCKHSSCRCLWG
jgi:hypothetical protein